MLSLESIKNLLVTVVSAGVELVREGQIVVSRKLPGLENDLQVYIGLKVVRVSKEVEPSHAQRLSSPFTDRTNRNG